LSLINTEVKPFKVEAYHNNEFKTVTEENLKGKWNVFFFYPADFTFVCPTELEDLQDHYEELQNMGVEVYSVSTDTHFTHLAWHQSSPAIGKIKYPMLADPTGTLARNFEVYIEEEGLAERGTFVVDPDGNIQMVEITPGGVGRNAGELVRKVSAAIYTRENPGEVCPAKWKQGDETLAPSLDLVGNYNGKGIKVLCNMVPTL